MPGGPSPRCRCTVYLPTYGAAATERTEARIAYDSDAIYVMVDAWEAHEGGVRASSMFRVERGDAIQPLAELGYGWVVSPAGHQLRASVASAFAYRNAAGEFDGSVSSAILEFEPPSGALWTLTVSRQEDDLPEPFTPVPDASVPAGRYTAGFAELKLKPYQSRAA